ncbi:MAG: hypothetical protein KF773_39940 [Deltaproteobacteria bacterium]|nr:hypothetical protein [Deltaproteobacteria bacterium]
MRALPLTVTTLLVAAATTGAPATASADDAFAAARRTHVDDVVWALASPCDRGDDVQQRQCRQVRDQLAGELAGQTLLVDGEASAVEVDKWSAAKKSARLVLSGCIRCAGLDVDGRTYFVAGAASAPRLEGGKLRANALHDAARSFADEPAATAWAASIANRRVQLLVKVPDKRRPGDTILLDIAGFRVFTPCNGEIVVANPASPPLPADPAACATGDTRAVASPDGVPELTADLLKAAMRPVAAAAGKCQARFQIPGSLKVELSISGDGSILAIGYTGTLAGTPAAACVDEAVRAVKFPRSQKASTKATFPILP